MSGNLWMFSDKLDDEDIEIMKHEFITYYQGADYYGLGLKMFTRLAHEAGAVYKIGKKVLIRRMTTENSAQPMWKPFVTSRRPPDSLSLKSAEISNESPQKEKCNQMAMVVNLTIMAFFIPKWR